jgi:hypothetical protein
MEFESLRQIGMAFPDLLCPDLSKERFNDGEICSRGSKGLNSGPKCGVFGPKKRQNQPFVFTGQLMGRNYNLLIACELNPFRGP